MTDAEKIEMVKSLCDETADSVISAYLFIAKRSICNRLFDPTVTELPEGYDGLHIEATVYLLNKRGAEGQTAHGENGISRSYENGGLPDSMFYGYTAKVAVVS